MYFKVSYKDSGFRRYEWFVNKIEKMSEEEKEKIVNSYIDKLKRKIKESKSNIFFGKKRIQEVLKELYGMYSELNYILTDKQKKYIYALAMSGDIESLDKFQYKSGQKNQTK